jgi:predicted DNA-binding transcriptional regulator AlpA
MRDSASLTTPVAPRLLRLRDAAIYLSSTTWFIEKLVRTRKIRSRIIGKRRVIDIRDLDAWIDEQSGSPSSNQAKAPAPSFAQDAMEILTPEEVAKRLKVSVRWVYEKRRPRAKNPIPCLPMGRYIRFDWNRVLEWLSQLAVDDLRANRMRRR